MTAAKPSFPILRTGSTLAAGLVCYLPFTEGSGSASDVAAASRAQATSGVWSAGNWGYEVKSWTISNANTADLAFTSGSFSVACAVNITAVPGGAQYSDVFGRYSYSNESTNVGWTLSIRPSSDTYPGYAFMVFNNNAATSYMLSSNTLTAGPHFLAGTSDGSGSRKLYVDGVLLGSTGNNPSPASTSSPLGNGTGAGQGLGTPACPTAGAAAWNRVLSFSEMAKLADDFFVVVRRRSWRLAAAAASRSPYYYRFPAGMGG